ncbi:MULTISPECIES: serine hydrolase domain-containing protein [unclassified Endozoicomonas]|uniref:serine hydrolase domain-containing protein n=1 Tax=unclassified Endozoicomonas TaxID=2644528 RepID=UPI003BAFC15C
MPKTQIKLVSALGWFSLFVSLILSNSVSAAGNRDDAYATPTEDFSVHAIKHGYSLTDARRLHNEWSLSKFLNITESGAYSYLHLGEFLPQAMIYHDGGVVRLNENARKSIAEIALKKDGESTTFEQVILDKHSPVQGVLVVKNGEIVYQQYPGIRENDRHVWMSNLKLIVGTLIALLEEEGRIDLQKTVADYLPKAKSTAWGKVKLFDVLNMQSGLNLEESPATRSGDTPYNAFVRAEVGLPADDGKVYTHDDALFAIPYLKKPGTAFEYSSANTQMLGLVIEEITQKRLAEVVAERIWSKASMAGDATVGLSPQGNAIIHGLVSSRLDDMARFGMLFTPS